MSANTCAQDNTRAYGNLFGGANTVVVQAQPYGAGVLEKSLPSQPGVSRKVETHVVPVPPPPIVPSAEPATFEGHAAEAKRMAEFEQQKIEFARKAQEDAEKAKANAPTVVVVQQPPPEVTLWNAITAVPAMVVRNLLVR